MEVSSSEETVLLLLACQRWSIFPSIHSSRYCNISLRLELLHVVTEGGEIKIVTRLKILIEISSIPWSSAASHPQSSHGPY